MKDILKVSILFVFALTGMSYAQNDSSETQFIKYRNYLIPIDVTPEIPPVSEAECPFTEIPITAQVQDAGNARIIIMSDMARSDGEFRPNSQGNLQFDADDIQSFAHVLTFSDQLDIEGIMSSPRRENSDGQGNIQSDIRFRAMIQAFGDDRSSLTGIGGDFPTTAELLGRVRVGAFAEYSIDEVAKNVNDPSVVYENAAVEHIVRTARCGWHLGDQRPLYVLSWGSNVDFAQAIASAPDIKRVIRFVSYSAFNEGGFGNSSFSTSCAVVRPGNCSSWNYLREQQNSDLWWVDYTGPGRPLQRCNPVRGVNTFNANQIKAILQGGAIGMSILDNSVTEPADSCSAGGAWLKIGDSITVAFVLNPAVQRNNPDGFTNFGNYLQHDGRDYWSLIADFNSSYTNIDTFYTNWVTRASQLVNNNRFVPNQ